MSGIRFASPTWNIAVDGAAVSGFVLSIFSLVALMSPNVFGESPVSSALYLAYYYTLRNIVPVIGKAYGLDAGIYLALVLFCFAIMNRRIEPLTNLLQTVRLGALIVLVFEVSLFFAAPVWRNVFVILAQIGTPLQWFTNDDLLMLSAACLVLVQLLIRRARPTLTG